MEILCNDHEDLIKTIALLVKQGLTFTATTEHLKIELSGGY